MLTYNRLQYTKETLEALLKNRYPFKLVIYDNNSTEKGMINFLKKLKNDDSRILEIYYSEKNRGLSTPTNDFWKKYYRYFPYLGKIDNDTIIPDDGVERLVDIMDHCPKVAICHGYHFHYKDSMERTMQYLSKIDGRLLLKVRWGGGCFYAMRSSIVHSFGYIPTKYGKMGGWTEYQIKIRRRGYKIVYAYPLVKVKHLGDIHSGRKEETSDYLEYNKHVKKIRNA